MKVDTSTITQYHLHKEQPERLQFQIHDLSDYLERFKGLANTPHSHSYYQIIWFYKAGGKHYLDFKDYPIETNTIFFVAKDQIHYFDKNQITEGILIHFNESFFMQSDVDIFLKYKVFNNSGRPAYSVNATVAKQAGSYVQLIKDEFSSMDQFGHKQIIRYLLKTLLILLERAQDEKDNENIQLAHYDLRYLHFRELLEQYYCKGYGVSDYAELLRISTKTLTTITKTVVSKSPSVIISERIILEAERLLSFTSLKVNEIGYKLGFEDDSYFIKYFKKHLKKSPGEYREAIKKAGR